LARPAAAQIEDQAGGNIHPPTTTFRIQSPLEAIAGIRLDSETSARKGNHDGVEKGDFQKDVLRLLRAARLLATHHPADALRSGLIGDHQGFRVKLVGSPIERQDLLPSSSEAHGEVPLKLVCIEDMQGAAQVE